MSITDLQALTVFMIGFLLATLLGLVTGFAAHAKGRPFAIWWLFGALLFPAALVAVILVGQAGWQCPECAESVRQDAKTCPHCRRKFDVEDAPAS